MHNGHVYVLYNVSVNKLDLKVLIISADQSLKTHVASFISKLLYCIVSLICIIATCCAIVELECSVRTSIHGSVLTYALRNNCIVG